MGLPVYAAVRRLPTLCFHRASPEFSTTHHLAHRLTKFVHETICSVLRFVLGRLMSGNKTARL